MTLAEHLSELFERLQPQCVLDVGANEGQYGRQLREIGYAGWIVSFEPVTDVFRSLDAAADGDSRWLTFQLALGNKTEVREIAVTAESQLSSFFHRSRYSTEKLGEQGDVVHYEEVEVDTLASWCRRYACEVPLDSPFLKVDTQGFDKEVLLGSGELVSRLSGLQFEASLKALYEGTPTYLEMLSFANERGFELTGAFPIWRDSLLRIVEMDCVMVNGRHPDAGRWKPRAEREWHARASRFRDELTRAVPEGSLVAVADGAELTLEEADGRPIARFMERDGQFWGAPADGDAAVSELARLDGAGASYFAVAWNCFWFFDEYPELHRFLIDNATLVTRTDAAAIFTLSADA